MAKKMGLGKGLEALFADNTTLEQLENNSPTHIKIAEIEPNRAQPRRDFDRDALQQLADSIREHGVIQPLILRPLATGGYQIVAGERRFRASRMAGLSEVPAILRVLSDAQTMEIALIENLQREDLNPVEEAHGYQTLMKEYQFTQDAVAKSVGKSRPAITNALRLLQLPEEVLQMLQVGVLSGGHARALLSLPYPQQMVELATKAVKEDLSVRVVENLVAHLVERKKTLKKSQPNQSFQMSDTGKFYHEMRLAVGKMLSRNVMIKPGPQKSQLIIEFYSPDDLKQLIEKAFLQTEALIPKEDLPND